MSEHTPGPWGTIPPNGPQGPFYGIFNSEKGWIVAPQVDGEANARLIAAAPDLLAACEAALERFEIEEEIMGPRSLLRHAIAKARGEAS